MYRLLTIVLSCQLFLVGTFGRAVTEESQCPSVASVPGAVEEDSRCLFIILSLSAYIYRPSVEMGFLLRSTDMRQQADYYNIEVIDSHGIPVGMFTSGDNICNGGRKLTHNPSMAGTPRKTSFSWLAPDSDKGVLFFRFSVGVKEDDGRVKFWANCYRQSPLKYFQQISPAILFNIENPLHGHNNFRGNGLSFPVTPPNTPRVMQESSAPMSVTGYEETRPSPTPVQTNYRQYASARGTIDGDGLSWCQPSGGPRFDIIPGTGCRSYRTYPNNDDFQCYPGLIFSVKFCVCSFWRLERPCSVR